MTTYGTFGHGHAHSVNGKTFDKDCVAVIESNSQEEGREKAFKIFNTTFFVEYYNKLPNMSFCPRGLIRVDGNF